MESLSRFYIVLPTIENYIVIPFAEGHPAIPSTEDCFVMHLFVLFILLNVVRCKFDSKMSIIHSLVNDYMFYFRICLIQCIQKIALWYFMNRFKRYISTLYFPL